jgi:hypothetical protein
MRNVLCLLFLFCFLQSRAQLPTDGLAAFYPFNNSAGDESGNKNDGQFNGAIAPAADRFGNPCGAVRFIGTGCYVSVPNSSSLKAPVSSLTITAWVKPERGINSNNDLDLIVLAKPGIEAGTDVKPQYCFQVKRAFGDSYSTITLSNDFSFQDKQYNMHPMEFNQWYFIAITYDEDFVHVFQDGKLIAQAPKNKPFLPNDFALEIGRDIIAGKKYFNGCLDDLRIYNRGLSFAEINTLFTDETGKVPIEKVSMNFSKKIKKNTDRGNCSAEAFFAPPTATFGCGQIVLKQIEGLPSGSKFNIGMNNLVYQAELGGQHLTDTVQLIVSDNEDPVFRCPTDVIAHARIGTAGVEVSYPGLSASDNCPNLKLEMIEGILTGAVFPVGVTTLKYKATDASGNTATCSFNVTVTNSDEPVKPQPKVNESMKPVEKNQLPTVQSPEVIQPKDAAPKPVKNLYINCTDDITAKQERGVCGANVHYNAPQVPLGNSIVVVQTKGQRSNTVFPCGTTTNTFTASDGAGTVRECSFNVTVKDIESPVFSCPKDTIILLPPNRKGLIYHYQPPHASDNCAVDSVVMVAGVKDGCFLQLGVHPFVFRAYDKVGNVQTCTYSVMVKEDATLAKYEPPVKLDAHLELGSDSVHYEHKATVNACYLTLLIYDDGEEDNDSVTIIFNDEVLVNRDMIRLKETGAFRRTVTLVPGEENFLIAKAWNNGRYGLNTLRIDVFETNGNDKKDAKLTKPAMSKVLHSRPGNAGGLLLRCN